MDQEPRTVEEAQEAARLNDEQPVDNPRVMYLPADEAEKPAPIPLSDEEHGTEPFDGAVDQANESDADFEAEEQNPKEDTA